MKSVKAIITWLLIVCLIPFVSGCESLSQYTLTGRVWDSDVAFNHSGPASSPDLQVYQTRDHRDFVVVYDEEHDSGAKVTRRAYLLDANQERIEAGRKPRFIGVKKLDRMQPIPVETNTLPSSDATNALGFGAVVLPEERQFTLLYNGGEVGTFSLPVYVNKSDVYWRVAVTPVTVTADVAIYGAIAAAVVGVLWVQGAVSSGSYWNYSFH